MEDRFKYYFGLLGWVGMAITLLFLVVQNKCNPSPVYVPTAIYKETHKIYDSTKKTITPRSLPQSVTIYTVPVTLPVDTSAVIRDNFAAHTFSQVIQDTSIRAFIFDSICQNKLVGRRFNYQLLQPARTIESSTITLDPSGIFAGGFTGGSVNNFGIGPEVNYLHKGKTIFGYSYDIPNKFHKASVTFKINARGNRKAK